MDVQMMLLAVIAVGVWVYLLFKLASIYAGIERRLTVVELERDLLFERTEVVRKTIEDFIKEEMRDGCCGCCENDPQDSQEDSDEEEEQDDDGEGWKKGIRREQEE